MPSVQESLQQVYSSSPPSYNFSSANRNLHRFRMCRLQLYQPLSRLEAVLQWDIGAWLFCYRAQSKPPRAAFGCSFGLKQITHWDYPFLLLQDFRQCCFYFCLFVYSCIYKGKVFQSVWKANTQQDWEQPETMLASAKAFPSPHQSTPGFPDNSPIPSCSPPEQWLKIAPLCWFLVVVFFEYIACMCFSLY